MLKKTITYTDFNNNVRTEDFYFNLSKAEITEWELRENLSGGLQAILTNVIKSNDGRQIMDAFRQILIKSYGIKSADGRSFVKSEEISAGFLGSEAYSVLFMELLQDPNAASRFVNGIVPADLADEAAKAEQTRPQPQDRLPKQGPSRPVEGNISRPPHESGQGFQQVDRPTYPAEPKQNPYEDPNSV